MMTKYIQVYDMERVNELVEQGYKLHTMAVETYQEDYTARVVSKPVYMMSLSSEKAYDNITNLVDIRPDQVDLYLESGWIVADSWSKIIRMVRKVE